MTYLLTLSFSLGVWLSRGSYDPSIPFLTLFFLYWVLTRLFRFPSFESEENQNLFFRFFPWIAGLMMWVKPNLLYVSEEWKPFYHEYAGLPFLGVLISFLEKQRAWIWAGVFLFFYLLTLFISPHPHIDVFLNNTAAADFFREGLNPYLQNYSDIYGGAFDYQPGFLYWPAALYLQTLSRILFQDIRIILVLAWWASAFLFPRSEGTKKIRLVWWSIPFLGFGFEQGWLDPVLSFCAVFLLWSIRKRSWIFISIAIATAASVKQYGALLGVFALPYLWSDQKQFWKVFFLSGFLFVFALLPFCLHSMWPFIQMTIIGHATAQVRSDSLNFSAFWVRTLGTDFSVANQAFFTGTGFVLALIHLFKNKNKIGLKVLPECWAIAFGFSMLFGKFGFCNYHWLLISFWILSLVRFEAEKE